MCRALHQKLCAFRLYPCRASHCFVWVDICRTYPLYVTEGHLCPLQSDQLLWKCTDVLNTCRALHLRVWIWTETAMILESAEHFIIWAGHLCHYCKSAEHRNQASVMLAKTDTDAAFLQSIYMAAFCNIHCREMLCGLYILVWNTYCISAEHFMYFCRLFQW